MLASVMASAGAGGGSWARPLSTPTRQVEQRARPPHTEARGTLLHAAHLQQRRPGRDADGRPAAIGHLDPGGGGAAHDAHHRHHEGEAERARETPAAGGRAGRRGAPRRPRPARARRPAACPRRPGSATCAATCRPATEKPASAATGSATASANRTCRTPRVPGCQAQPVVEADAAVHPHDQEQRAVLQGQRRPDVAELPGVGVVGAGKARRTAVEDHVGDQKQRDGEAGGDLRRLPERQPPGEPLGRSCRARAAMWTRKADKQDDRARPRARDRLAPALHGVHRLQADEAQRVVGEVCGGEQ